MLLLSDGLAGHQQALLTGVHRVAGAAVPVAGGAAGDDRRLAQTFVFHDGEVLTDGAVGGLDRLAPAARTWWSRTAGSRSACRCWSPGSTARWSTRSAGGRRSRSSASTSRTATGGARPAYAPVDGWPRSHAFGLIEPDGTQLIRGAYLDETASSHVRPLPPYSAVQIVAARARTTCWA